MPTEPLFDIAEPGEPILAPAVGARTGVVVRQVTPGIPIGAVVLPHGAPLPFAEIRPPQVPVTGLPQAQIQPAEAVDPLSFRTCGSRHCTPPGASDTGAECPSRTERDS